VAPFVDGFIVRDMNDTVALGRNDGFGVEALEGLAQMIGVERLVGQHGTEFEPFDQVRDTGNLTALTRQKFEADEVSKRIRQRQDLGRQSAFRSADGLILSPPLAPLAFW